MGRSGELGWDADGAGRFPPVEDDWCLLGEQGSVIPKALSSRVT